MALKQLVVEKLVKKRTRKILQIYLLSFYLFFLLIETFRNCADIAIISNTGGGVPPIFVDQSNPYLLYYRDSRAPEQNNIFPLIVR